MDVMQRRWTKGNRIAGWDRANPRCNSAGADCRLIDSAPRGQQGCEIGAAARPSRVASTPAATTGRYLKKMGAA